ncbi:MAG TPA: helix-turn-helix transcriptional regulator [Alphaproteobacteria bacterium]|nr:helix-turn-helix transcriptional regulator [Alphaproteobacteria bacterium]
MKDVKWIGKRIKAARKASNFTQELLAEKAGLSPTYIGQIERGERVPTLQSLLQLIDALGVDITDIIRKESITRKCDETLKSGMSRVVFDEKKKEFLREVGELVESHFAT